MSRCRTAASELDAPSPASRRPGRVAAPCRTWTNPQVERLAEEVARITGESKTEAIRRALIERRARLRFRVAPDARAARVRSFLAQEVWSRVPPDQVGRAPTGGAGEHPRLRRRGRVIVDTSVLLAIPFQEPGHGRLVDELLAADAVAAGTPTRAETGIVLNARLGSDAHGLVERLLDELGIQEIPFGELHWRQAVDAFRRYGEGRHPARLNFGDCMTYASAKLPGEPLLFVGEDFALTDVND